MRSSLSRVDPTRAAVLAEVTMLTYFVIQNYVDPSPWNNLPNAGSQLPSTLMGLVPGIAVVAATLRGGRLASPAAIAWVWIYPEAGRVVPDAEHMTLQTLSILAAVLVTRAARARPQLVPVDQRKTAQCPVAS
jgi:hypothetical protein